MTADPGSQRPAHYPAHGSVPLIEGSVGDALHLAAQQWGGRPALQWAQGDALASMTYAELLLEAKRVARWLTRQGDEGDRVAVWSRNSVEWVLAEYGCALAGMVIASWNPDWADYECEHARNLTEPVVILAGHDTRGASLLARAEAIGGNVVALDELSGLAAATTPCTLPAPTGSALFLIQFTSGTTGRAEGAAISHRAAINAAWLRCVACGADENDVWVNAGPLSHVGDAITLLLGAMVTGGCYVLMGRFEASDYLRLMRVAGATRIGGVPTMLLALLDHPDWRRERRRCAQSVRAARACRSR